MYMYVNTCTHTHTHTHTHRVRTSVFEQFSSMKIVFTLSVLQQLILHITHILTIKQNKPKLILVIAHQYIQFYEYHFYMSINHLHAVDHLEHVFVFDIFKPQSLQFISLTSQERLTRGEAGFNSTNLLL